MAEKRYIAALARMAIAAEVFADSLVELAAAAEDVPGDGEPHASLAFDRTKGALDRARAAAPHVTEVLQLSPEPSGIILARG